MAFGRKRFKGFDTVVECMSSTTGRLGEGRTFTLSAECFVWMFPNFGVSFDEAIAA